MKRNLMESLVTSLMKCHIVPLAKSGYEVKVFSEAATPDWANAVSHGLSSPLQALPVRKSPKIPRCGRTCGGTGDH